MSKLSARLERLEKQQVDAPGVHRWRWVDVSGDYDAARNFTPDADGAAALAKAEADLPTGEGLVIVNHPNGPPPGLSDW